MLMVKAGAPTDATIDQLIPHLDKGDILIDGGNTLFTDTQRRNKKLSELGYSFYWYRCFWWGRRRLKRPSIMPGGQKEAYELSRTYF